MWQRAEDPHGNPWVALVVDPQRSLALGQPDIMGFRVYPPEYMPPAGQGPDGIVREERLQIDRWGACWNRYYKLNVEYYRSELAAQTLGVLRNNFLWMSSLDISSQKQESIEKEAVRIERIKTKWEQVSLPSSVCESIIACRTARRNLSRSGRRSLLVAHSTG